MRWDIGPLTDRELDVMREALQAFSLPAERSPYTESQRAVARDLDERCRDAHRIEATT